MADHPPAARRAIIRHLKRGAHPAGLLEDAAGIQDGGHAAAALIALAADERLPAKKAAQAVRDARKRLAEVDRPGRMAEAWGDVLQVATGLQRGPEVDRAVERLQAAALAAVIALPDGQWTAAAVCAVAPHLPLDGRDALLRRGLADSAHALEVAKAVATDERARRIVAEDGPPDVVARFADDEEAIAAAWRIGDIARRREALRVLASKMDHVHDLMALGGSSRGRDAVERVAAWTIVAARLDRLGHDPAKAFDHAVTAWHDVEGPEAMKAHRKLAQAMERSGLTPPSVDPASAPTQRTNTEHTVPVVHGPRHVFALVDGYAGGLAAPHLRAVARAAPLCAAFDLDLVLMGFPTEDAASLVDLVDAETNVGEGTSYARQLLDAGRLRLMPLEHGVPDHWPGTPVATTPHPAVGRAVALHDVAAPVCLLVGQGKQGLPRKLLAAVPHHHELTGQGISLETGTAMGILADRLGRIPLP